MNTSQATAATASYAHTTTVAPVVLVDLEKDTTSCSGCYAQTAHLEQHLDAGTWATDEDGETFCGYCVEDGGDRRAELFPTLAAGARR